MGNKSNNKKHRSVDLGVGGIVRPTGETLFVDISVNIMCPANIKAHNIVNHSEMS